MFKPTIINVLFVLEFKEMTKTNVNIYKINKMHVRIKMYVKNIYTVLTWVVCYVTVRYVLTLVTAVFGSSRNPPSGKSVA